MVLFVYHCCQIVWHTDCVSQQANCGHGWADDTRLLLELSSWIMSKGVSVAKDYENNMISLPSLSNQDNCNGEVLFSLAKGKGFSCLFCLFVCFHGQYH